MAKRILFLSLFFFCGSFCFGQSRKELEADQHRAVIRFLNLSLHDSIADIGSGSGYNIVSIAKEYPTLRFTVEDIDSSECNRKSFTRYINGWGNKTNIGNFDFHYGTETSTGLRSSAFNKVLIFDVVHELTYPREMLADIKRILAPGGSVFIKEILVHKKMKRQKGCNYPFLTDAQFKTRLQENGLVARKEEICYDNGRNRYIKLFECVPVN